MIKYMQKIVSWKTLSNKKDNNSLEVTVKNVIKYNSNGNLVEITKSITGSRIKMKHEVFNTELGFIKDERIRESCEIVLDMLPDYFYEIPASPTGKYHPNFS